MMDSWMWKSESPKDYALDAVEIWAAYAVRSGVKRDQAVSDTPADQGNSAPGGTRTPNRPGRNRLLYPLSYGRQVRSRAAVHRRTPQVHRRIVSQMWPLADPKEAPRGITRPAEAG